MKVLYFFIIVFHFAPEDGAEDYPDVFDEAVVVEIIAVNAYLIGINDLVVIFLGYCLYGSVVSFLLPFGNIF